MGQKTRWIAATIEAAKTVETKMPWERGLRRQALIASRLEESAQAQKVSLPPMPDGVFLAASA